MSMKVLCFPWYKMRERYSQYSGTYCFLSMTYALVGLLLSFIPYIGAYAVFFTLAALTIPLPLALMRNLEKSKVVPILATLLLLTALVFNVMKISDIGWENFWNSCMALFALTK